MSIDGNSEASPGLSSETLKTELLRLVPSAKTKKRRVGQEKSQLACLLFEAHRTEAWRDWKARSLGSFVQGLGIKHALFEKLKTAGKALYEDDRELYGSLMKAVATGGPRPVLAEVSKLAMLPTLRKQGSELAHDALERHAPITLTRTLAESASYGRANRMGRRTLQALDAFSVHAGKMAKLLEDVAEGEAGRVPNDLLKQRLRQLCEKCEGVMRRARDLGNERI